MDKPDEKTVREAGCVFCIMPLYIHHEPLLASVINAPYVYGINQDVYEAHREYLTINPNYCPMCGKPLSVGAKERTTLPEEANEALTLEELREMDGQPVWTVTLGLEGSGRWELLTFDLITACPFKEMILMVNLCEGDARYEIDTYGKTWIAYRRKVEEA